MALFHLVRHGEHELQNRVLAGRMEGVGLSAAGVAQVDALVRHFVRTGIDAVYASPLQRTRETAAPIAAACGVPLALSDSLLEVDFGAWTGLSHGDLEHLPDWQRWNAARSLCRAPGGETIAEVQARMAGFLNALAAERPEGRFVVVSHAESIRAALAYYLGMAVDLFLRVDVSPGCTSVLGVDAWGVTVQRINAPPHPDDWKRDAAP